jgi:hypothetical protein
MDYISVSLEKAHLAKQIASTVQVLMEKKTNSPLSWVGYLMHQFIMTFL